MSWTHYYKLLEKYNGDLQCATEAELEFAARMNPDNPKDARAFAAKRYEEINGIKVL